jgi:hypothetical protein
MLKRWRGASVTLLLGMFFASAGMARAVSAATVSKTAYHGWSEAFILSNGTVEAVVVPAVGRIMQFRFAGEEDGPFWENRALDGQSPNSQSSEWINFGGDKTWPAPQADWEKMTGRDWPPPQAFDSLPVQVSVTNGILILRSPVDPHYGISTERRISLSRDSATMSVDTLYRKMEGAPVQVSVWVITQLKNPERMFMPLPPEPKTGPRLFFPDGYNLQSKVAPADLVLTNDLLSCTRSPRDAAKIGSDASHLVWGNDQCVIDISSRRGGRPGRPNGYPDNGSSAEIYTNPDPNKYVEFELLGTLATMKKGDAISRAQTYRLYRRNKEQSLEAQVKSLLYAPAASGSR